MSALRPAGALASRHRRLSKRALASSLPVQQPDELVAIVNQRNEVVGSATRAAMRAGNLWHRSSFVFLHRSSGELFVQQRVAWKETYPSHHDPAPGGVVGAGESYEENAAREAAEEMGVVGAPLEPLFDFPFADGVTRVWGRCFRCVFDGPLVLQASEVAGGQWLSLDAASALEPVCPDSALALAEYVRRLRAGELPQPGRAA